MFSATTELEKLLGTEQLIIDSLDSYLSDEENRLKQLKHIRDDYAELYNITSENIEQYIANPVNAYILVKRLTKDWKTGELHSQQSGSSKNQILIYLFIFHFLFFIYS